MALKLIVIELKLGIPFQNKVTHPVAAIGSWFLCSGLFLSTPVRIAEPISSVGLCVGCSVCVCSLGTSGSAERAYRAPFT